MSNGFSLIELVIVLAIIGILSTIAYPGYQNYIIRAHRSDGQTALLDLANRLERYYSENNTYQNTTINDGVKTDIFDDVKSSNEWYILSIVNANNDDFLLQATPIGTQGSGDILCQTLTLTSSGTKGITSGPKGEPIGTSATCWRG